MAKTMLAGGVATVFHDAVMTPADVVKQRLQMYNSPYRSAWACFHDVFRREGLRAFYRSYGTTLSMNIPFQGLYFLTYESMQELTNPDRRYSPWAHIGSGAMAGGIAAAVTTPLDVCKTLLNTQETTTLTASKQLQIRGLANAARTIFSCCGVGGFFQGMKARVWYTMPSTAISWFVYESFKFYLGDKTQ